MRPLSSADGGTVYYGIEKTRRTIALCLQDVEGEHVRVELTPADAQMLADVLAVMSAAIA